MYIISVIIYLYIICVIQTPGGIAGIDRHNSPERSDSTSSQQSSSQPLTSSLSSSHGTQQLKNAKSWTGMYRQFSQGQNIGILRVVFLCLGTL